MADATNKMLKRPHPEDGDSEASKRARSNNGSPVPSAAGASTAGSRPDVNQMLAAARAKAEALKARMAASKPQSPSSVPTSTSATDRLAQLKARVAAATSRSQSLATQKGSAVSYGPPQYTDEGLVKARGGLDIGLHPALLADAQQDARTNKGRATPKFATTLGNKRTESPAPEKKAQLDLSGPSLEEIKANPYFDASLGPQNVLAKPRHSRQLIFNQKGKYIQQGAALRRQAQLEDMKRRIAERARQAGIDEDLTEKAFLVPAPPDIEWWDEGLVDGKSYDAIDDPSKLKIDIPDTIITVYVQHPVLIAPPQEKIAPAPKPMYLTSKEQAKLRRQRRMAELKEQQAKIRLGLEPPPPPKVKLSNLMRVVGQDAVHDPTAVEARVRSEIEQRKTVHEHMNEDRKLTKEEKAEKLEKQQAEDAAKGIHVRVYKIDSLANGKHRYQVSINAEQNKLTGVCIMHPRMNLVIVEGGSHSIRFYD